LFNCCKCHQDTQNDSIYKSETVSLFHLTSLIKSSQLIESDDSDDVLKNSLNRKTIDTLSSSTTSDNASIIEHDDNWKHVLQHKCADTTFTYWEILNKVKIYLKTWTVTKCNNNENNSQNFNMWIDHADNKTVYNKLRKKA
jgi:hypothetical protein